MGGTWQKDFDCNTKQPAAPTSATTSSSPSPTSASGPCSSSCHVPVAGWSSCTWPTARSCVSAPPEACDQCTKLYDVHGQEARRPQDLPKLSLVKLLIEFLFPLRAAHAWYGFACLARCKANVGSRPNTVTATSPGPPRRSSSPTSWWAPLPSASCSPSVRSATSSSRIACGKPSQEEPARGPRPRRPPPAGPPPAAATTSCWSETRARTPARRQAL